MDFSGDFALWQRRVTEAPEGVARRMAAFNAMGVAAGQAVMDLGCGGGHLVRDLARAVGESGRAVGFDVSADQISAATALCEGLPAAELVQGDGTDLPFSEASFDAIASIQTLEYIADVGRALAQVRRVLKPGGRAVLISVLWDHWRYHGAEPALNERILDAWRAHCPHQMLPMELPSKLRAAGFAGVSRQPIGFLNGALHENSYAYWAAKVVAGFAIGQGISEKDAGDWLDQLAEADRQGRFGFVSVPVMTVATAA